MGPLDDPPTANKGGCGPLFWINLPGLKLAGAFGKTLDGTAVRLRRRRELELFRDCCGARRFAVARFRRELVLSDGSSGENVGAVLVFEAVGIVCSASVATAFKFGESLWRAGQT